MTDERPRELYQVFVTTRKGTDMPVGPAMSERDAPAQLAESINKQVRLGKERDWKDARVITVTSLRT